MDPTLDLTGATIVGAPDLSGPERQAVIMLVDEVERRTRIRWPVSSTRPAGPGPVVYVERTPGGNAAEGYRLTARRSEATVRVTLLRLLHMRPGAVALPADVDVATAPRYPLRGHQLGYRDKTNSYCGWDLPQWEQYVRDLVVFGANAIELIPPRSDDNLDSVHFARPPLEMMTGVSGIADRYGIDVWIWFPLMDADYADPFGLRRAEAEWREVFEALPRVDAVFVPGGDPGHLPPDQLFPTLRRYGEVLRESHPDAGLWVSPQGFSAAWLDAFCRFLSKERPSWLTGIVHGPQVHLTTTELAARVPDYPLRAYPDITHSLACQYPVPDWDIAYALTEGREPINPRPHGQAAILRATLEPTIGFLAYSEGCNDDVNKDPTRDVRGVLREYARYFIGPEHGDEYARGLLALERNWQGPLALNEGVTQTLRLFQHLEAAAPPRLLKNWRFQQALYRAYYDAYVRSRLLYERGLEEAAMACLRRAGEMGALAAVDRAEAILRRAVSEPVSRDWRTRVFQLAEALFQSVHMQLSVPLYRAQSETRGANLDGIDRALNDRDPGPGGWYDDLGAGQASPRLVGRADPEGDPAFLRSPLRGYAYRHADGPVRRAWCGYTCALADRALEMRYDGLDPQACYRVRVVYAADTPQAPLRMDAVRSDGRTVEVHPYILKPSPQRPLTFDVPPEATRDGTLTLRWRREPGHGGNGRGCGLCEVWLLRTEEA